MYVLFSSEQLHIFRPIRFNSSLLPATSLRAKRRVILRASLNLSWTPESVRIRNIQCTLGVGIGKNLTIWYVSRYFGQDTIHIKISRYCDINKDENTSTCICTSDDITFTTRLNMNFYFFLIDLWSWKIDIVLGSKVSWYIAISIFLPTPTAHTVFFLNFLFNHLISL